MLTHLSSSSLLVELVGHDDANYRMGVEVIFNFLKYVQHHDVCPEYAKDVQKAQKICETALEEIPAIGKVMPLFPGQFSNAARRIFCEGNEESNEETSGESVVPVGLEDSDWEETEKLLDVATARIILGIASAILLDPKLGKSLAAPETAVGDIYTQMFEIREIRLADDDARAKYNAARAHLKKANGVNIETCGSLVVQPTIVRNGWDNTSNATLSSTAGETYILEESILEYLKVGMKISLTVCTLNVGFKFIKEIWGLYPTFYVFLPQQLMLKFKEPLPDRRPAPSVHNPDTEEDILSQIPIRDIDLDE